MRTISTDVLVIGGGSGGLSIAAGASQMGARVTLLEGGKMGGDCLNFGCVPSKALLAAAHRAHAMQSGRNFGIKPGKPVVNYAAVKDHVQRTIEQIAPHDSQERFEGLGVRVIRAYGKFVGKNTVEAGDTRITARRIVLATGSYPVVPPIAGLDTVPFFTNETIFDLRDKPEHLLIIGGGPIGLEMAQAHYRLGSRVTVIEGARALAKEDPELAKFALDALKEEGVEILEGAQVQQVQGSAGDISITTSAGTFQGSHLLLAVGRRPCIEGLQLEAGQIAYDAGGVSVDANLRTTNRRVYAIGDVAGGLQFTHVAGYQASVIARSILFGIPTKAKTHHIPWATYTDPEIAHVGLSESQAQAQFGPKLSVVRSAFSASDRAVAEGKARGLIKVMVVRGRPVGASIVGPMAGELIAMWAMAIAANLKMSAISSTVLPYPTIMELNKRATGAYFSPILFENVWVKRVVRIVQRVLP